MYRFTGFVLLVLASCAALADTYQVAARALNRGLHGPWSAWVTATASHPTTAPDHQTGLPITAIRTGHQ